MTVALPSSRRTSALALAIGGLAAVFAAAGAIALAHGAARTQTTPLAATTIIAGCAFVTGGIVAWLRQPANRIGPLMMATGFLLFGGSLAQANQALPFTIGLLIGGLPAAVLAHLVLAFPDGRLHSPWERAIAAVAYVDATVAQVVMLMFMGFGAVNGCPCPTNLLLVRDDPQLHSAIMSGQQLLGVLTAGAVGLVLERRWRVASAPLRRAVLPLFLAGAVTIVLYLAATVTVDVAPAVSRSLSTAQQIALATIPIAYLLGLFNARLARGAVSDLVTELAHMPEPGLLRDALARSLGDPSLELAYWIPEVSGYVGIDGRPIDVQATDQRAVRMLDRGGRPVAALIHDPALGERPELLAAVSSAAGLALENERLQAELRAQLEELRESRARIVQAGDAARQRLERNLHDGAQQRFVTLSVALALAQSTLQTDPDSAASALASAREELAVGLAELREIARGLHPAVLNNGLEVALTAAVRRSPVVVDLRIEDGDRLPRAVEATVYYIVSEALTNVTRYAHADAASVSVTRRADQLEVIVADNGVGGARIAPGSGLEGLRDRVEAIGGDFVVHTRRGEGTRITACVPIGTEPAGPG